jgi:hypothetical protein
VVELIIKLNHLVRTALKAIKHQGLFFNALGYELVVQCCCVDMVVMVVVVAVIVMHHTG